MASGEAIIRVEAAVKIKAYDVIEAAVERGVRLGYRRAHKHTAAPSEEGILLATQNAVMEELAEVLEFFVEG